MPASRRVAVIGGGWAGLAAAVEATRRGHQVTLYEMAPQLGGRAREVDFGNAVLDNGQHILIGAYNWLDLAPKGRDEDQLPWTMAWVRHHDRYESSGQSSAA